MDWLRRLIGRPTTPVCGRCASVVITNAERLQGLQRIAKQYGGSVDENGQVDVPRGISSFSGPNSLQKMTARAAETEEIKRNLQRDINENASRCGFRCKQCGKVYCLTCLGKDAKTHPVTGGKACFACGGSVVPIDAPAQTVETRSVQADAKKPDVQKSPGTIQSAVREEKSANGKLICRAAPIWAMNAQTLAYSRAVSAETKRWACIQESGTQAFVVVDGVAGPKYEAVGKDTLLFSPDGKRLVYTALRAGKWFQVLDGIEGRPYTWIGKGTEVFSPDSKRFAYAAAQVLGSSGNTTVVVNEVEGAKYDGLGSVEIVFSPDSRRVGYSALRAGREFRVIDGVEGKDFDNVANLVFSPDGKQVAYIARRDGKLCLMVDDEVLSNAYDNYVTGNIVYSPDGKRLIFVAQRGGRCVVVADGVEPRAYDAIAKASLHFSPDGQRLAFAAKDQGKAFVVVDGVQGQEYESTGWCSTPVFSPDSKHVAYGAKSKGSANTIIVVDDEELKGWSLMQESRLIFDNPRNLHTFAIQGPTFCRLDVEIIAS